MSPVLTRSAVLNAALWVVDHEGLAGLTMRRVGQQLGVEGMAIYRYVASREDVIRGVIELVLDEVGDPLVGQDWQTTVRAGAHDVRRAVLRHPRAVSLITGRTLPDPAAEDAPVNVALMGWIRATMTQAGAGPVTARIVHRLVTGLTMASINAEIHSLADTKNGQASAPGRLLQMVQSDRPLDHDDDGESDLDTGLSVIFHGITSSGQLFATP